MLKGDYGLVYFNLQPQAGEGPGADKDAQNRVCITAIACPTCNKVVPVPTSGVANFQVR